MKQKHYYDKKSDSLFIKIKDDLEERFEEAAPGVHIEFNDKDEMIGIEILKASRFSDRREKPHKKKH